MKLHLPKSLRRAVLSCLALAGSLSTTIGTGFIAGGAVTIAFVTQEAKAAPNDGVRDTITITTNNADISNEYYGSEDEITFDLTDSNGHLKMADITISAQVVINNLNITNGSSGTNNAGRFYRFENKISGEGPFSSTFKAQHYTFSGDMSEYSGSMSLTQNTEFKSSLTFDGNTSGTGSIEVTNGNVLNVFGATMKNSSITTSNLNISGASSFAGNITATNTSVASGSSVTLAGTQNNLGALTLDLSGITTGGTVLLSSTKAITLTGLTLSGIDGVAAGTYNLIQTTNDAAAALIGLYSGEDWCTLSNENGAVKMVLTAHTLSVSNTLNIASTTPAGLGYVVKSGGVLGINNGNGGAGARGAGDTVNVGPVTVESGGQVKIWSWVPDWQNSTHKDLSKPDARVTIASAINLEGGRLHIEDGSYNFDSIKVSADSEFYSKWGKCYSVSELSGEGTLNILTQECGTDEGYMVLELKGANDAFKGDVSLTGSIPNGSYLVISDTNALNESTVTLGNATSKLALNKDTITLEGVTGTGSVELCTLAGNAGVADATLTLNVSEDCALTGILGSGINLVKNGAGLQSFENMAVDAERTIVVNEGVLEIIGIKPVKSIYLAEGTILRTGLGLSEEKTWGVNSDGKYTEASSGIDMAVVTGSGKVETKSVLYASGTASASATDALATIVSDDLQLDTLDVRRGWVGLFDADNPNEVSAFMKRVETVKLDAAGLLAAGGGFVAQDAAYTTNFDIHVGAGGAYLRVFGDGNDKATFNGAVSGTGTLHKTDTGTVVLAGDMSGFSGPIEIHNGLLQIGGTGFDTSVAVHNGAIKFTEDATISRFGQADGERIIVDEGAKVTISSAEERIFQGKSPKINVGENSVLTDNARVRLTNATLQVYGGGTYELNALVLSGDNKQVGNVNVAAGTTLNITGTNMNTDSHIGSFVLSNWSATNTVDINGTLIMNAGFSNRDGKANVNVKNGGVLQFNSAMEGINNASQADVVNIYVENGGTIKVAGSTTNDAGDSYKVNLQDGATIQGINGGATMAMKMNVADNATASISTDYMGMVFKGALTGNGIYEKKGSGSITLGAISNLKLSAGLVQAAQGGLNISGALTMNGGAFYYEGRTADDATVVDKVTASSYVGALSLVVSDLTAGTYDLFQGAAGLKKDKISLDAQLARGKSAAVSVTDNGLVSITITGEATPLNLEWDVSDPDNAWSVGSSNWKEDNLFYSGDNVTFAGAGEKVTVSSDIVAGKISVTGDNYEFTGGGTITASGLTVAAEKTLTISTSPGNAFGGVTLGDGATLNLGVNSRTDVGGVIGTGSINLLGAAYINITAGDFIWGRAISGENADLTLTVSNNATIRVNGQGSFNGAKLVADGGKIFFTAGASLAKDVKVCNNGLMSFVNTDSFNYNITADQKIVVDGATIDFGASRQSFNQYVKMSLNNATLLGTGQVSGGTNNGSMDFFNTNTITATGTNLIEASLRLYHDNCAGLTMDVQSGTTTLASVHGNTTTSNGKGITKKGAGTLVFNGVNRVGSLTINDGVVALDKAATLGAGAVSMSATEDTTKTPALEFRGGETKSLSNAISGAGALVQVGLGSTTLSGLAADWAGTVKVKAGTLNVNTVAAATSLDIASGATLGVTAPGGMVLGSGKTLSVANGAVLNSALTLSGGTLALGSADSAWALTGGLDLGGNALTLDAEHKTALTLNLGSAEIVNGMQIELIANTTATLAEGATLGTYFHHIDTQLARSILSMVDGKLIATMVVIPQLEWNPAADDDWKDGGAFGAETFRNSDVPDVHFGQLTGTEVVTVDGSVTAGSVVVAGGAEYVYEFDSKNEGVISAATFAVENGTIALADGVLADDVTIDLADGVTLKWGTTADAENTTDYSGRLTVDGDVTMDLNGNNVTFASNIGALEDSTISIKSSAGTSILLVANKNILGTADLVLDENVQLKLSNSHAFANNISGEGSVYLANGNVIELTGANTYSGETILGWVTARLSSESLSKSSSIRFEAYTDADQPTTLNFINNQDGYLFNTAISSDEFAEDAARPVVALWGKNMSLAGDYSTWDGTFNVTVDADATVDLTGKVGGKLNLTRGTLKIHSDLSNSISGGEAGKLLVEGGTADAPIEWDSTGKTYTGTTTLAANTYVTAGGTLSTGAGAVNLSDATSTLEITNSADWKNKVSGTGTLVLTGNVDNFEALVDGGSEARLSNLVVGTADDNVQLEIDSAGLNASKKVDTITVTAGSNLKLSKQTDNYDAPSGKIVLAGAGSGTGETAAALSITGKSNLTGTVELAAASTIYSTSIDTALLGVVDTNGYTLTKTGSGVLNLGNDSNRIATKEGCDLSGNLDIREGKVRLILTADANTTGTWGGKIIMADGTELYRYQGNLDMAGGLAVTGTATYYVENGKLHGTTISGDVTGDSSAVIKLTKGFGEVVELTTAKTFEGTWQIGDGEGEGTADGDWNLTASHADALQNATVMLNDAAAKLVLNVESANLAKLTGTTGTVVGSGKTLNIANTATVGVEYSGAIGDGVTICVSEGYQKITGNGKTGNFTIATARVEPSDDELGGGALAIADDEETPVLVLDMAGYAHSSQSSEENPNVGATNILVGNQGCIKNLTLAENMVLTTRTDDELIDGMGFVTGRIASDLTLAGGVVKLHMGEALSGGLDLDENGTTIHQAAPRVQYDLAGGKMSFVDGTVTDLKFLSEAATGKVLIGCYQLFMNVSDVVGIDDWVPHATDSNLKVSADLTEMFKTNFSVNGRTTYELVREDWKGGLYNIGLLVAGNAADLTWKGGDGTWNSTNKLVTGSTNWNNSDLETDDKTDGFWDDDNAHFIGDADATITIEDNIQDDEVKGVRIGSMTITGSADYIFQGAAITSGEGLGNVLIGTTDQNGDYDGIVTFDNENTWKGSTYINDGHVVAKKAGSLSDTFVHLKGEDSTLTLKGVSLSAQVNMEGGVLIGTGESAADVDMSTIDTKMSLNATADSTLTVTPTEAGIAGDVTVNDYSDSSDSMTGKVVFTNADLKVDSTLTIGRGSADVAGAMTNAGTVTVKGGTLTAQSGLTNSGTVTVKGGSLTADSVENSGSLAINGGTVIVGADGAEGTSLTNTGGTITIGTTGEGATTGSLTVNGDLEHSGDGADIVVNAESSMAVTGNLNGEGMILGFGGDVTVGGDLTLSELNIGKTAEVKAGGHVAVGNLQVAEGGLLHATDEDTEDTEDTENTVEIGTLSGEGTVQVDNGTLHIGELKGFTGKLAGDGTLSTGNEEFLLEAQQNTTTTDIIGGIVRVTEAANGSIVGDVTTNEIIIDELISDNASLSMSTITQKDGAVVSLTLSEINDETTGAGYVSDMLSGMDAEGVDEIAYHLLNIREGASQDIFSLNLDEEREQQILQAGKIAELWDGTSTAVATFNLRNSGSNVYLKVRGQGDEESVWNLDGAHDKTEAGLVVLKDGKLVSDDILDNVRKVVVTGEQELDLTVDDISEVTLNGLTAADKEAKLSITGDIYGSDQAVVNTAEDGFEGTLVLSKLNAQVQGTVANLVVGEETSVSLDVTDTAVKVAGENIVLSGTMSDGSLGFGVDSANLGEQVIGGDVQMQGSTIEVEQTDSATTLDVTSGRTVIADLGGTNGEAEVTLTGKGFEKYFTNARLEGGKVVADRNTEYAESMIAVESENGAAGAELLSDALVTGNPQANAKDGILADLMDVVDSGNMTDADAAAVAGSSIATLGMALSGDVERQLRAIRNRTTSMGVNECVVNEGMPYFNAWVNAEGNRAELDKDETLAGYTLDSWGGTIGFDVDLNPNLTVGMAITAMYGDLQADGPETKAEGDMDTYYVSLFARYASCAWTHTFVATVGMMDGSFDRTVGVGNGYETEGTTDGMSFGLMYEVGYVMPLDEDATACLQPVFNVMLRHSTVGSYTEEGGDAALDVESQSMTTLTFGLGARLQAVVGESVYNRASIFEARVLGKVDVGDRESEADVAFAGGSGHSATVKSAELGAFGVELGAGLTIPMGDDDGSIFVDGSVEMRSGYTNFNGTVGYRINF